MGAPETSSNVVKESESRYPTQKTGDRDVDVTAPSSSVNEGQADSTEDIDLPDAGAAEPETAPAPPKKNPGFQFLE